MWSTLGTSNAVIKILTDFILVSFGLEPVVTGYEGCLISNSKTDKKVCFAIRTKLYCQYLIGQRLTLVLTRALTVSRFFVQIPCF